MHLNCLVSSIDVFTKFLNAKKVWKLNKMCVSFRNLVAKNLKYSFKKLDNMFDHKILSNILHQYEIFALVFIFSYNKNS